jgi:formylglycine-generating enzyme
MKAQHITFAILLIIVAVGCSDKNDKLPVAPNGNTYDPQIMVLIPAGTFRMGNITEHPEGWVFESPVHEVTITRPFLMARTEVTQEQYEAVMGSNPSNFKGPDLPVERVSWYEAVEYCNELSRQDGLDPCYSGSGASIVCDFTANGFRLPTEAEWEYACRAGTETDFHTGNMTHSGSSPIDPALDRAGWYGGNCGSTTHPVGEKEPNAFGLYDMHGNVYEWCWDWYSGNYYASSPAEDPRGPASGSDRVVRGGSWGFSAGGCRSAGRGSDLPVFRNYNFGFRLVRTY